jgi:outer membrane protein TolC
MTGFRGYNDANGDLIVQQGEFVTVKGSLLGKSLVAQTVFDAGSREQKQRAAEATTEQAVALYRTAVLAGAQNVADVLRALQADERALAAATAAESSASRSIELARAQIDRGQVSIAVMLTAQQAYLQASLARVQAQAARLADTVALFQALGGQADFYLVFVVAPLAAAFILLLFSPWLRRLMHGRDIL